MKTPSYTIHELNDLRVIITDDMTSDHPSVTNAAVQVISDLDNKLKGLGLRRVFYRDTIGRFDEIKHNQGVFTGFKPCSPSQQEAFRDLF